MSNSDGTETVLPGHEYLEFRIMDCGIIYMKYGSPTKLTDILSEDTALLPETTIKSLAEGYLYNIYKDESSLQFKVDNIKFGLMMLIDPESPSSSSLIPVWEYYTDNSYQSILTINAIDGTRINTDTGISLDSYK